MLSPTSALLWETRHSLRWRLWTTFFALLLFPGLIELFTHPLRTRGGSQGVVTSSDLVYFDIAAQMVLMMANLQICLLLIGQAIGMPVRQFTLPVSSRTLATLRLLPGALSCTGLYLAVAGVMNLLFGNGWPLLGPALAYGVGYMVMYAAVYRFRGNDVRMGLSGLGMGAAIIFWLGSHYGSRWWLIIEHPWPALTATELVILMAAAIAAWSSLVDALERDRRGAGWGRVIHVIESGTSLTARRRTPARRFWSPITALFWQEWKQDGWFLPGVIGGLTLAVAAIQVGSQIYFLRMQNHANIYYSTAVVSG